MTRPHSNREPGAFLVGDRIALRPLEESDLARCAMWMNDPELREVLSRRFPMDLRAQTEWYRSLSHTEPRKEMVFAIVLRSKGDRDRTHIGNIELHGIDWTNRKATSSTVIGEPKHRGLGFGGEAKALLLDYAFGMLDLHRINAYVNASNLASQRCLTRCGYIFEGNMREAVRLNGARMDLHVYGILAEEWRRRPRTDRE